MSDAPIIVTALLGKEDFAWLNTLRQRHFPPERNFLPVHVTLFHHLPPSVAPELKQRLAALTREYPAPTAQLRDVMKLGKGVAYRIESEKLAALRDELASAFAGLLTPQDQADWRPHITVQNKVTPDAARALHEELSEGFSPRPLAIAGLASWYYRGGPWEPLSEHRFSG
ncbi:2'-5' RNA ligase family protein [uncultured Parasphingopyxis sp.]|uniref:2'-5' RNA ligase family protein n=1 Tax=uncultured Parasphingopyxis sp. TaxID=1547918 RepID=UPI00262CDFEF|nr:2'-5' RNA ligase family protein [uncultured Parasphingopyxis sp.]